MTATTLTDKIAAYCNAYDAAVRGADDNPILLTLVEIHRDNLLADIRREFALDTADPWRTEKECPECNGFGWLTCLSDGFEDPCPDCGSRGVVTDEPGARVVDAVREVQAA